MIWATLVLLWLRDWMLGPVAGVRWFFLGCLLGVLVLAAGCKNDAITFAKTVYGDKMKCNAINTSVDEGHHDTAVCRGLGLVLTCTPTGCQSVFALPVERP